MPSGRFLTGSKQKCKPKRADNNPTRPIMKCMKTFKRMFLIFSTFSLASVLFTQPVTAVTETELFVKNINKYAPTLAQEYTEIQLKFIGKTICSNLDRNIKVKRIAKSLLVTFDKIETGVLISSSVVAFCPEQTPKIEKYFNL